MKNEIFWELKAMLRKEYSDMKAFADDKPSRTVRINFKVSGRITKLSGVCLGSLLYI